MCDKAMLVVQRKFPWGISFHLKNTSVWGNVRAAACDILLSGQNVIPVIHSKRPDKHF